MALDRYLADEVVLDCADGILSRREALRRLVLLGVSAPAAAALLAACSGYDDDGGDATATSAPDASSGPTTGPSSAPSAMVATSVGGKVLAMWMPITLFFGMTFEHSVVNMFLFPSGILMGAHYNWADYFIWNEIPTVVGNLVGGLTFVGATLYSTHYKTSPQRAIA